MSPALPRPVADYVAANARLDPDGMLRPFAPDAVVRDDGGQYRGHAELRTWIRDATIANRAIFVPEAHRLENGRVVVEGLTSGDFRGSPLRFTLRFTLEEDAIRALEIA